MGLYIFLVTFLHAMLRVSISSSFSDLLYKARNATGFWLNKGITMSPLWCQKCQNKRYVIGKKYLSTAQKTVNVSKLVCSWTLANTI